MVVILLEARNDALNVARSYRLSIETNLFAQWVLTLAFGRIGRRLVYKYFIFASEQACLEKAKRCLRKRATAERRIGCAYRIRRLDNDSSVEDVEIQSWLISPACPLSPSKKSFSGKKQPKSANQTRPAVLPLFDVVIP